MSCKKVSGSHSDAEKNYDQNVCMNLTENPTTIFKQENFFSSPFKQTFFAVSPLALSFQSVFMCQTKFSDDDDDGTFESCFSRFTAF